MPCFCCSARQTDPARGASPWRRAVLDGVQVLVCPACQAAGVDEHLDRCAACGSVRLAKSLGEVMCRGCGRSGPEVSADVPEPGDGRLDPPAPERANWSAASSNELASSDEVALADEVAAALARTLGRGLAAGGDGPESGSG